MNPLANWFSIFEIDSKDSLPNMETWEEMAAKSETMCFSFFGGSPEVKGEICVNSFLGSKQGFLSLVDWMIISRQTHHRCYLFCSQQGHILE